MRSNLSHASLIELLQSKEDMFCELQSLNTHFRGKASELVTIIADAVAKNRSVVQANLMLKHMMRDALQKTNFQNVTVLEALPGSDIPASSLCMLDLVQKLVSVTLEEQWRLDEHTDTWQGILENYRHFADPADDPRHGDKRSRLKSRTVPKAKQARSSRDVMQEPTSTGLNELIPGTNADNMSKLLRQVLNSPEDVDTFTNMIRALDSDHQATGLGLGTCPSSSMTSMPGSTRSLAFSAEQLIAEYTQARPAHPDSHADAVLDRNLAEARPDESELILPRPGRGSASSHEHGNGQVNGNQSLHPTRFLAQQMQAPNVSPYQGPFVAHMPTSLSPGASYTACFQSSSDMAKSPPPVEVNMARQESGNSGNSSNGAQNSHDQHNTNGGRGRGKGQHGHALAPAPVGIQIPVGGQQEGVLPVPDAITPSALQQPTRKVRPEALPPGMVQQQQQQRLAVPQGKAKAAAKAKTTDGQNSDGSSPRAKAKAKAAAKSAKGKGKGALPVVLPVGQLPAACLAASSTDPHPPLQVDEGAQTFPRGQEPLDENVTTLIVRNVPSRCTQVSLLKKWPPMGSYNLLYVPYDHRRRRTIGFAFINFISHQAMLEFRAKWRGQLLLREANARRLDIGAAGVQGLEANILRLRKSKKIRKTKRTRHMPVIIEPDGSLTFFRDMLERMRAQGNMEVASDLDSDVDVEDLDIMELNLGPDAAAEIQAQDDESEVESACVEKTPSEKSSAGAEEEQGTPSIVSIDASP